jgi:2-haloacid dehalogenase
MKYDIILFDADNTILDFDKAEFEALRRAFGKHGIEVTNKLVQIYRKNNIALWQQLEKGLVTKDYVLNNRFINTAKELSLDCDILAISRLYEEYLHEGHYVIAGATNVMQGLIDMGARLYLVTNGVLTIQNSRLKGSGIGKYFVARFISEEVGCPKPQVEFFYHCFERIENFDKCKTLIVGDSLTSDIQGGINAGIDSCWYNPKHEQNTRGIIPTYEIDDLEKLFEIVR